MTIRIEIAGMEELRRAFSNLYEVFDAAVADAVEDTVYEIDGEVKRRIARGPATGRVYEKYNPRRTHTASAPGQPPMTDTGRLVNSIEFDKIGDLTATVGSKLAYAAYLEYGTSRIAARPFFRPAIEEIRPKYMARLEKALGDELR